MNGKTKMYRVRPKGERTWSYCDPADVIDVLDVVDESADVFEVQAVYLTDDEIAKLPEFEGW